VVTFGAALLGWIAGGMIVTDVKFIEFFGEASTSTKLIAEVVGALLIVALGHGIAAAKRKKAAQA
jgi:predicted tellurium resistance membrane protein TerC